MIKFLPIDVLKSFVVLQPLGRASFFPSEAELKKSDAKVDQKDLNNRLFKYKGGRPSRLALAERSLNDSNWVSLRRMRHRGSFRARHSLHV